MDITSLANVKVKEWVKLQKKKHRDERGLFLIEGEHLVEEANKLGIIEQLIIPIGEKTGFNASECYYVTPGILKKISTNISNPKIIAVCRYFELPCKQYHKIILLDGLQDPGNIGTIIRTAVSFEFDAIYLSLEAVDRYNEKLIRATQGALFQIPVIQGDLAALIFDLKEKGMEIYAASLNDAIPLQSVSNSNAFALIFGNEGKGISKELLKLSDFNVKIEMEGFESLNVGVAAGILMYHFSKV